MTAGQTASYATSRQRTRARPRHGCPPGAPRDSVPKLFIKGEPGATLGRCAAVDFCRARPAQREVTVAGIHFLQEDAPDAIGEAIASWLTQL